MQVTLRLHGFEGFPGLERALAAGTLVLDVRDDARVEDLLRQLAATYGSIFETKRFRAGSGPGRVRVFAGGEPLEDPQARLADALAPGAALTIALLRPLRGG